MKSLARFVAIPILTVEEETLGPADFEDAGAEEENGP
jgi:hypothetical protein